MNTAHQGMAIADKVATILGAAPAPCCPSPWMAFYLIADAQAHRAQHGGWVFLPNDVRHPIWFNTEFTPSAIFTHHITAGMSGRLL